METINKLKLKEILGNILESMQDAKRWINCSWVDAMGMEI